MGSSLSTMRRREALQEIFLVTPQFILYLGLTIVPLIIAIPMVMTNQTTAYDADYQFVGLSNFVEIFQDQTFRSAFLLAAWHSVRFFLLNYVMMWITGLGFGLLVYELTTGLRKAIIVILYLPYVISGLAVGLMIGMLFDGDTGTINHLLLELGVIDKSIDLRQVGSVEAALVLPLTVGWKAAGYNMSIFLAGLLAIPGDTIDQAAVDGANYPRRVWSIYLPQMVPYLFVATAMCIFGSFKLFDLPVGLGALRGNRAADVLATTIYRYGFGGESNVSIGLTMSVIAYVPLLFVVTFINRFRRRHMDY